MPEGQTLRHIPQCEAFMAVSTHTPPQLVSPVAQQMLVVDGMVSVEQLPVEHTEPVQQGCPAPPQATQVDAWQMEVTEAQAVPVVQHGWATAPHAWQEKVIPEAWQLVVLAVHMVEHPPQRVSVLSLTSQPFRRLVSQSP